MKKISIVLSVMILSVLACGALEPAPVTPTPGTDRLSTVIAETMQAITPATSAPVTATATIEEQPRPTLAEDTPTPTAPATEILITVAGKSFSIPPGVATGATLESVPGMLDSNLPIWAIYPAHEEFILEGYALQNKVFIPKIVIYPKEEFSTVNEGAAEIILDMQNTLANQSAPLNEVLPFLPLFNAGQIFHSNEKFLAFQNGIGVRFLTQFGQAPAPVNNHELFYTFQGLTNDGAYYVAAILPVNAAFLIENAEPETSTPADGIPFDWNNFETLTGYIAAVKQKLNTTAPNAFTPTLSSLDQMIQSLSVTGNQ
jgi:hypothetical protein